MILVVMGVAGSGKTTIARMLAERLGWRFQEGDALHPPANVAKMSAGTPLTDDDRWPWLHTIARVMDGWRAEGASGIVTCSALKRAYRDILVGGHPDVPIVHLAGEKALIAARMAARKGHFMPTALLDSQFATLEPPGADENPIVVDIGAEAETIVQALEEKVRVFFF
ncbi:MAG: gluconokinase [Alphaproteobacteria bacterium]|nr:gluconokinase [Alphaproteobacteria bacterium]